MKKLTLLLTVLTLLNCSPKELETCECITNRYNPQGELTYSYITEECLEDQNYINVYGDTVIRTCN